MEELILVSDHYRAAPKIQTRNHNTGEFNKFRNSEKFTLGVTLTEANYNYIDANTNLSVSILQEGDVVVPIHGKPVYIKEVKTAQSFITKDVVLRQSSVINEELPPWALALIIAFNSIKWYKSTFINANDILRLKVKPIQSHINAEGILELIVKIMKHQAAKQALTENLFNSVAQRLINSESVCDNSDTMDKIVDML